jgi:hypothetical protein
MRRSNATSAKPKYLSVPHPPQPFTIETTLRNMAVVRLQAILACLTCGDAEPKLITYPEEKAALLSAHDVRPNEEIADDVVATLLHTKLVGPALKMRLDSIVGAYGWRENIAKWVLEKLTQALQYEHEHLGSQVRDAYHKAWEVAKSIEGFVIEHPVMSMIIALGVLAIIAPWVLPELGFGELGPIEGTYQEAASTEIANISIMLTHDAGSFASWWQATYGGLVPKGSLFSFLQRLGMKYLPSNSCLVAS